MTLDKNSLILALLRDHSPQFDFELAKAGSLPSGTLQARLGILHEQGLVTHVKVDAPGEDGASAVQRHYSLTTKGRARLFSEAASEINSEATSRRPGPRRR